MEGRKDYDFMFIPGYEADLSCWRYLQEKMQQKIFLFQPDLNTFFPDYFSVLKQCDALIASRYHLLLAGVMLNKPTFALSYADKTESLLKEVEGVRRFEGVLI